MPADPARQDSRMAYRAAQLYYLEELGQAAIAERLAVSRPTVSRLLAEARRVGIVRITVHEPGSSPVDVHPERVAELLGIDRVWLVPSADDALNAFSPAVGRALREAQLSPGDALLVSSGRTTYELSRSALPALPGVDVVPTVGGVAEPEPWHQTNEIVRAIAERAGARPHFLFAPAMPSPAMRTTLDEDPEFQRVTSLWHNAKAALVGVGAPPAARTSISTAVPVDARSLQTAAGDVCLNFFTPDGSEVTFPGSDRMVRISPPELRQVPYRIAVAAGAQKTGSIIAGASAGLFNRLVTDIPTAEQLLAASIA